MHTKALYRVLVIVVPFVLVSFALAPSVFADRGYHSRHLALTPVGGAPLKSGFVQNIHVNGPRVYAQERYVLIGATPNTAYQVQLQLYPFDPSCSTSPATLPSTTLKTNVAGNAAGKATFRPADIPAELRDATHGVVWVVVTSDGEVAYHTACEAVTLD